MKVIDISMTISSDMEMFPGDPPPVVTGISQLKSGDRYNISWLQIATHTGTHIDPPLHLITEGTGIDKLPLELLAGPARVLDMSDIDRPIEAVDISQHTQHTKEGILLLKGAPCGASLTKEGAQYLVDNSIRTIGTDALSIGAKDEEYEVHQRLLNANIAI